MAAEKKTKNYKTCEYCRIKPCYFVANGAVEYGDHCRNFKEDKVKVSFARRNGLS